MKPLLKNIFLRKYTFLVLAILLFAFSFFFNKLYSNRSSVTHEVKVAEEYLDRKQTDFQQLLKDTTLIRQLVMQKEPLEEFKNISRRGYGIFFYTVSEFGSIDLKFWSDKLAEPDNDMLLMEDGEYLIQMLNGYYYVIRKTLPGLHSSSQLLAFALIPVRSKFFIESEYLPEKFLYSSTADKHVMMSKVETDFPVKSPSGKVLFHLVKRPAGAVPYNDTRTLLLRFGGLLLFLIFLHLLAEAVARRKDPWVAIGLLAVGLIILRGLTYYFPSILNLRQFDFFDPQIYGSNPIHRSLGDVLINAGLFCWIVLFAWAKLRKSNKDVSHFPGWLRWTAGILSLCLLIFSTFILATVIRSLIADSKISFDVINFFSLDQYTIAGFALLACLSLTYYYFSQLLFRFIFPLFAGRNILIYFFIGFTGLIFLTYLTVRSSNPDVIFYLPVLLWLLGYTWVVNRSGVMFNNIRINITGTLSWIFIFSISIASIMFTEIRKVEWEKRKRMADRIASRTDPSSERMMSIAMKYIDNDFLTDNFPRFHDPEVAKKIRDSILVDNYLGYLDKYDTRLYMYDSAQKPLNNEDPATYESLNTVLTVQSRQTNVEGLYYYESAYDKFNYITRRDIFDSAGKGKLGFLFIVSYPKNFSAEALLPELFRPYKGQEPENSPIYSNAVYDDKQLVSPPGNYPFATWLTDEEVPQEEFSHTTKGGYDELWYRANNRKVVVIARKKETIIETITLFSYIFCSFLILVGLVQLITFILRALYNWKGWRQLLQLNIRSQVHSTIIFISIFSFVVIGVATISFFISRFNRNNSDKLSRTMKIMVNEMEKKLSDHSTFDDVVRIYDTVSASGLQNLVNEVSDIHGVDVNVYDLDGNLKVSSEANVYTKGVLSKKIDPGAFYHLNRLRQIQHSQEETIGDFSYLSIYAPVRDKGIVYGYINIPYFTSKPELQQEISNFLVTIINLNAFIFLIAGLIALFITNRITRSFSLISDKMKEVNLGKRNEAIVWSRSDEIGELVNEYNTMVNKLEASAIALAKSEREGAWREMARQVAHEIKNPLTPMKLSIQYLQKAINNNHPNVKELSGNVASTLVEQIDHLSKIAADFSQFANIGNTHVEQFDLHEVIGSLKELFRPNYNVEIDWQPIHDRVMVEADKTQMNRLFTNLLTNAVEACKEDGQCRIGISERREGDRIHISIKDDGEGIPPDMRDKIFVPNFTTKSSGTGLGLAMCKGIVEQAHGTIWFETEEAVGTTFHVELPLVVDHS